MADLLTSVQMRGIEAAAIAAGRVSGLDLMERAGQGVTEAIFSHWPGLGDNLPLVIVLCGPGNNGGDGFVVARLMQGRGCPVFVFLYGDCDRLPADARTNHDRWTQSGQVWPLSPAALALAMTSRQGARVVVIDALFGIGLSRPLPPDLRGVWQDFVIGAFSVVPAGLCHFVCVDVPSGVSQDDPEGQRLAGFAQGENILTVTFHGMKAAHRAMLNTSERIVVVDIGLGSAGLGESG